jgi:cytochrome c-type biogenesis protein CcmH
VSGWLALSVLAAIGLGALRLFGLRGAMLQLAAAALLLGASGYALQGRPGLPESLPAAASADKVIPLTRLRNAFFGEFAQSGHWLLMSDSMARKGRTADAAGLLRSAVREHPDDPALWIGLGNALVDHSGMLTPAAEYSYRRAIELAPGHPAALFFLGLARARSGDRAGAVELWRQILSQAPADASWRPLVEDAVAALTPPRNGEGDRSP